MKNLFITLFLTTCLTAFSQISIDAEPFSFNYQLTASVEKVTLPPLTEADYQQIEEQKKKNNRLIVGKVIDANIDMQQSGTWEVLPNGDRVWRLQIKAEQAKATALLFKDFYLPENSRLFVYQLDKSQVIGAFSAHNNHESGIFSTEIIHNASCIIEYYEPFEVLGKGQFTISGVNHIFHSSGATAAKSPGGGGGTPTGIGDAASCQVNINCSPEGDNWQDEKRGVARVLVYDSGLSGFCSGSLINNARQDCTPYFLFAFHCSETSTTADYNSMVFYFNMEAATCSDTTGPTTQTITGCTMKANSNDSSGTVGSDFVLVELNSTPPASYNVYYNGWDKRNIAPINAVGISHPNADLKKILTYNSDFITTGKFISGITHWRGTNMSTTNGFSFMEPGSSGSPLLNNEGLITGTQHGANYLDSICLVSSQSIWYGKLSYSWNQNGTAANRQLQPWLDPDNTGISKIQGTYTPCSTPMLDASISDIITPDGSQTCDSTVAPVVKLTNFGLNTLTNVTIRYRINSGTWQDYSWIGSLPTFSVQNVTLPNIDLPLGSVFFEATTSNPNGMTDMNTFNDTSSVSFFSYSNKQLPLQEGFEHPTFPPNDIYAWNVDNDAVTYQGTTVFSGYGVSTTSAFLDHFNYNILNTTDYLITPSYDFSTVLQPTLSFDYAYTYYQSGTTVYTDTFQIFYTADCGSTFNTIFKNGGNSLSTRPPLSTQFIPTPSDWVTEEIDLSFLSGESSVTFYFCSENGYGNTFAIDNINIQNNSPIAGFTASDTLVCPGSSVNFTDTSVSLSGATNWAWSFPGGTPSSSALQNPTVTYATPGDYNVTLIATDAIGTDTMEIVDYISISTNPSISFNTTMPACNGGSNGSATANPSGALPYSYAWSTSATTQTATGLSVGTYYITVTDANGCTTADSVSVDEPTALSVSGTTTNTICSSCVGTVTITGSGGSTPYFYYLNGVSPQLSPVYTDVCQGSNIIEMVDANGCLTLDSVNVDVTTDTLSVSFATTDAACTSATGVAVANTTGGTAPYNYVWNGGVSTDSTFSALLAGTYYSVSVSDSNGCSGIDSVMVGSMHVPFVINTNSTPSACDVATGAASANVGGATAGYSFDWSTGNSGATQTNLSPSVYTVSVTNNSTGCMEIENVAISSINGPVLTMGYNHISCFGTNDGEAFVSAAGGSLPYTYLWSDTLGQTTDSIFNLSEGTYNVQVTDSNGCVGSGVVTIVEPSELIFSSFSASDVSCFDASDGSISYVVAGGVQPYSYLWDDPSAQTTSTAIGLDGGTYSLQVTDSNGCTISTARSILEPAEIIVTVATSGVSCFGGANGALTATTTGGTGAYSYTWTGGGSGSSYTGLGSGEYTVTVTDSDGCIETASGLITQPADLVATLTVNNETGTINSVASGGVGNYSYLWSDGSTTTNISGLSNGSYSVTVTDGNGCTVSATETISIVGINDIEWINMIEVYPNPMEDILDIRLALKEKTEISIALYDILGKTIERRDFKSVLNKNMSFNVETLAQGIYYVKISNNEKQIALKIIKE